MQIRNKLDTNKYAIGTMLNIIGIIVVFNFVEFPVLMVFLSGVLLNHYLMALVVADLTGIEKNTSLVPTWLCGMLKLLILFGVFTFGMVYTENRELFLVFIYIFQLIILALSIKRVVKKY